MRIAVGIATTGRAAVLAETLKEIARQTRRPDAVIISPVRSDDVDHEALAGLDLDVRIVPSAPGLPRQRNAVLGNCEGFDAIVFFDDDYFPQTTYVANAIRLLEREPDVVIATGVVIEDGIAGPGLSVAHARRRLAEETPPHEDAATRPDYGAYGCNMVVRLAPVRDHAIRFDEALPLYAWQEDIDFSRQLAARGRVVRSPALTGVHLGVKRGRQSGVRFGYSQIANPVYLMRKGTVSLSFGGPTIMRNIAANVARVIWPEDHIDRRGRLKGNLLAFADVLRGRLHPRRILEIE
jgi:GT2 family glycosyltransferase